MSYIDDLSQVDATTFISRANHASAVLGKYLYIDGGELLYNNGSLVQALVNKTLAVDLSVPWTNATVTFQSIDKGGAILNSETLWASESNSFYRFGGSLSWWAVWPNTSQPTVPELWVFTPDGKGNGAWADQTQNTPGFAGLDQPTNGICTSGNGLGFCLGGFLGVGTWPAITANWTLIPVSGMIIYNATTNEVQNITAGGYSNGGTADYGASELVPVFGSEGVLLTMGGWLPSTLQSLDLSAVTNQFNQISVFDPSTQTWYNQTATGTIPEPRTLFCTVGVLGDNETYEIFLYGGTAHPLYGSVDLAGPLERTFPSPELLQAELDLDEIYVLSLPSFTWFKANYAPVANRNSHTCEVYNSQMLTIGGLDFAREQAPNTTTSSDIFLQGMGVFNMSAMTWQSSFNPTEERYVTPQVIKQYLADSSPTPSWNDPTLAKLFATQQTTTSATSSSSATGTATPHHSDTGAIAGGVVGGILGLLILLGVAYFIMRRRKRSSEAPREPEKEQPNVPARPPSFRKEAPAPGEGPRLERQEMLGSDRPGELGAGGQSEAWELRTQEKPGELEGDMQYRR